MKRVFKGLLALSVAFVMSFFALTACGEGEQEKEDDETPSTEEQNPAPDGDPAPGPSWTTAEYDAFVAKMGTAGNYTFVKTEAETTFTYRIEGDKVHFYENDDVYGIFWYAEGEDFFQLKFESDKYYHKTRIASFDTASYIYNDMKSASITDFDEETQTYTVTMGGATYTMVISNESVRFEGDGKSMTVEYVDDTKVQLPKDYNIKDDTAKPSEPNPPKEEPDDPVLPDDKIYTVDAQGNRTYNSKLLGETIKELMNSEAEDGTVLFTKLTYGYGVSVNEVLFVVTQGEDIQIGTLATIGINTVVDVFRIAQSTVSQLAAEKQAWVDAFSEGNGIDVLDVSRINYAVSMEEPHHEVLMQIAKKAFDKLAEEGVRSEGLNTVGTPEPRYANSEVLAAFEGEDVLEGQAGLGLGYIHTRLIFAIIRDGNGVPMAVEMNLASTSYASFEESVLDESGLHTFVVYQMTRAQEIDAQFFETDEGTDAGSAILAMPPQITLPQEKRKYE